MNYAQYVLINEETGIIRWHESHDNAIKEQEKIGGVIYNTATCDPHTLYQALTAARNHMDFEYHTKQTDNEKDNV